MAAIGLARICGDWFLSRRRIGLSRAFWRGLALTWNNRFARVLGKGFACLNWIGLTRLDGTAFAALAAVALAAATVGCHTAVYSAARFGLCRSRSSMFSGANAARHFAMLQDHAFADRFFTIR
jgi:hypothetical protein